MQSLDSHDAFYPSERRTRDRLAVRFVEIGRDLFAICVVYPYAATKIKSGASEKDLTLLADPRQRSLVNP